MTPGQLSRYPLLRDAVGSSLTRLPAGWKVWEGGLVVPEDAA